MCGIGSDAFAIVCDGNDLHGLNASGRSPKAWNLERFAGRTQMPTEGWDCVTVPGVVSAWASLSERFGKLPFGQLFEPAIEYAHNGYALSPIVAAQWANQAPRLQGQPGFAEAPLGMLMETPQQIKNNAERIATTVQSKYMPIGNLTGMTDEERAVIARWYAQQQ